MSELKYALYDAQKGEVVWFKTMRGVLREILSYCKRPALWRDRWGNVMYYQCKVYVKLQPDDPLNAKAVFVIYHTWYNVTKNAVKDRVDVYVLVKEPDEERWSDEAVKESARLTELTMSLNPIKRENLVELKKALPELLKL